MGSEQTWVPVSGRGLAHAPAAATVPFLWLAGLAGLVDLMGLVA